MTTPTAASRPPDPDDTSLDHHSPYFRDHAYEALRDLRTRCPVARSSAHDGFWILTDYASTYAATQDDDLFRSAPSTAIPAFLMPFPIIPIETDPPLTQKLRAITIRPFSARSARRLEPVMREIATDLIDVFIERGSCDIVEEFTTPLPARVMLRMLGFDESRWRLWVDRVHAVVHKRAHDPTAATEAAMSLFAEIGEQMEVRRDRPADSDLFAAIVHGTVDGEPLSDPEIVMYGIVMMLGGMDTTAGLTGNTLWRLMERADLRQRLIADRSLLPTATEEFLRHDGPTLGLARTVSRDCEFFGRHFRQGDRVLLMWGAANRDPAVFEDPDTVDFDRADLRHLGFGVGAHRCLGSNLARLMFQVMIDEILTRLPDFRAAGDAVRFEDAAEVYAVRSLPVTFTPGPRSGNTRPGESPE